MSFRFRAGDLRHVVTIETRQAGAGTFGEPSDVWVAAGTFRAAVRPMMGKELLTNGRETMRAPVRFYARVPLVLPAGCRLRWRGVVYDIVSVVDLYGSGKELEIIAEARQ